MTMGKSFNLTETSVFSRKNGDPPPPYDTITVLQETWLSLGGVSLPAGSEIFWSECGNCQLPTKIKVAEAAFLCAPYS